MSMLQPFLSGSTTPSFPFKRTVLVCCAPSQRSHVAVAKGQVPDARVPERTEIRFGLPSKGRMTSDILDLLKDCQLSVKQVNPRQYVAQIPELPNLEVWLQRPKDIVRKLASGDLDLGIVGFDTLGEYGQGNEELVLVHDALEYGDCRLSLADGALEAAPAMGIADAILDLVSSGTTLKENNLKETEGGIMLESQAVLVASRKALIQRKGALDITREILERLEARLRAVGQFTITANMRGSSAEEVAERILGQPSLSGLQGPTLSPVFCKRDGKVASDYFAIVVCVPKKALYKSVQQLRAVGGSGVLVSPLTYIFDKETPRWPKLLGKLGL